MRQRKYKYATCKTNAIITACLLLPISLSVLSIAITHTSLCIIVYCILYKFCYMHVHVWTVGELHQSRSCSMYIKQQSCHIMWPALPLWENWYFHYSSSEAILFSFNACYSVVLYSKFDTHEGLIILSV